MSVLFLLASLGAVNGLLLGLFFLVKGPSKIANVYFSGLLISLSIRIAKSIVFYFQRDVDYAILQVGLSACAFIGPFFFLYAKSVVKQSKRYHKSDLILLAVVLVLVVTVGTLYPYRNFPEVWNSYIIHGIYVLWSLFTLLGVYYTFVSVRDVFKRRQRFNKSQSYFVAIALTVLAINITYQMALYGSFTYLWGALIFTIVMYVLIGKSMMNRSLNMAGRDLPVSEQTDLMSKLNEYMLNEKPFVNSKLKLEDLASAVGMNRNTLSKLLNDEYGKGFSHYVNSYRIEEAKQLIASRPELSLEGIGYEAGFNSKSSFFASFRKITGKTPADFKK